MIDNIASALRDRLHNSPYWSEKTKETAKYINELICPACGKPEAFTYYDAPFALYCHRGNKCSATTKLKSLFPEIWDVEKKCPPTKTDPHAPALYYLNLRGIVNAVEGLNYEYWPNVRKTGAGAVMFPVPSRNGHITWNGRIFNPPAGTQKGHNKGETRGLFWRHPGKTLDPDKEVFVTEGILDALSFWEMGEQAIAVLASGQDPKRILISGLKNIVFAFDNDPAGHKALRKWKEHFQTAKAIMLPEGTDWNDFLLSNQRPHFKAKRVEFEWRARLALAYTAQQYAETYYGFKDRAPGLFVFNDRYFWSYAKTTKDDIEIYTKEVSNFTMRVDHYQLDLSNVDEPSHRFNLHVKPVKGRPTQCTVTSLDLYTPYKMINIFLDRANVSWSGDQKATNAMQKLITESRAPVVRQTFVTGYDHISKHYFTNHFMIDLDGKKVDMGPSGFFKVSANEFVRPAPYATIKPTYGGYDCAEIYDLFYQAWGNNGLAVVAWVVASWFVRQIKEQIGFFPILSLHGDTQTGKTMLTRYCNALQCLDEEGLPMSRTNTGKGEIRKLAQRSGLFKAMLEWPVKGSARFDLDAILTMYNEAPLQVRAVKSNDLQTHELPFLAALMFVQNKEPFCSKAQKERVISLRFKKDDLTDKTSEALKKIMETPLSDFATFFGCVMESRPQIEAKWKSAYEMCKKALTSERVDARVRSNHALLLAFHMFLRNKFKHDVDIAPYIERISAEKHMDCLYVPETVADFFIDTVIQLKDDAEMQSVAVNFLDYDERNNIIWIHSAGAYKAIKDSGFVNINPKDLYNDLVNHPSCIKNNVSHRFSDGIHKAWKLDATKVLGSTEH